MSVIDKLPEMAQKLPYHLYIAPDYRAKIQYAHNDDGAPVDDSTLSTNANDYLEVAVADIQTNHGNQLIKRGSFGLHLI